MAAYLVDFYGKPSGLPVVPPDEMYDKIEFAITCNENITDSELNDYILASQGTIIRLLQNASDQMNTMG